MAVLNKLYARFGRAEQEAYERHVQGLPLRLESYVWILAKSIFQFIEWMLRNMPGGVGFMLRRLYYGQVFRHMGRDVLIDMGVMIHGPHNVSVGDHSWIDAYCILSAQIGEISIGRRIHIGPYSFLGGREPITLEDYVGLSAGVKLFSGSEHPGGGKRMSGPVLPMEERAFRCAPITLRKDSFVGANGVLLPGVTLEEGAVVGAQSLATKTVPARTIVAGTPARKVGKRDPVKQGE